MTTDPYSFSYDWCDIPLGMTVAEYRTRRTRPSRRRLLRWISRA
jgi:hypothetical protein